MGLIIALLALAAAPAAAIGPGDLKRKAEKKAKEAAEKAGRKVTPTPSTSRGSAGFA